VQLILKYFSELSLSQQNKFEQLPEVYAAWNERINVISRKDIEHLSVRHVLHSLAISKFIAFKSGISILDVGTGGGFPGIPLAILFPEVRFQLVDSIGKKVRVVQEVKEALGLSNCVAVKARMEELKGKFSFIVSRAVAPMKTICNWTEHLILREKKEEKGWIFLKGGDLSDEIASLNKKVVVIPISDFFEEEFFVEKYIVFVPV
jgi:16S rRNA (guanine527-N7)-methyltransferase